VDEVVRRIRSAGALHWPEGVKEDEELQRLAVRLEPEYGAALSKHAALEDATRLSQAVARHLKAVGAIDEEAGALALKEKSLPAAVAFLSELLGADPKTFAGEVLKAVEARRMAVWRERVEKVDWELFDWGVEAYTWLALEEVAKGAGDIGLVDGAPHGAETKQFSAAAVRAQLAKRDRGDDAVAPFAPLKEQLQKPFAARVFFWRRTSGPKGDLVDDEFGRVLQVPGWSNIFTQPIINRIEMLSTGVRTDIGVKVFGPDLDTIERVSKDIEAALKPINGARDVVAGQVKGKGYLDIDIDRAKASRYGVSVEEIKNTVEMALGGQTITQTVEGRERFPVRLRYARSQREDEEAVRRLLVTGGVSASAGDRGTGAMNAPPKGDTAMSAPGTVGDPKHQAAPAHAGSEGKSLQVPLGEVADVHLAEGPPMIKSENGQLLNYVTLMVRGRDIVGFVDEAQRTVAEKVPMPQGVHVEWSGEFEHQVHAAHTLRFVFPAAILLIFVILYLTYKDLADAGLMMLAVPEALAGGAFFQFLFPKLLHGWSAPPLDFGVAVWVGYIACFGMATETGIIMLVYLREAIDKRGGLENIKSLEELRQAVIEGAVHRLRPKLLTEGVAIIALAPMLWATGVGAEIIAPMAVPVLGGLLISDEVVDIFLPVRFYWVRRARWLKLQKEREAAAAKEKAEAMKQQEMAAAATA
jgi:Cu(I)/Ag(I) efflux system membrane protein CusA/SilA